MPATKTASRVGTPAAGSGASRRRNQPSVTRPGRARPGLARPGLTRRRATLGSGGRRGDEGLAALELAILTPLVIAMLLLVVGLGRVSHGRQLVDQAAAAAARAAALTNAPGPASNSAQQAAKDTLSQAGVSCGQLHVNVDTGAFRPGGYVDVTVRCTANLSGLALAGMPGSVVLVATSRSVLEAHRDYTATTARP
jgi:Flp pilus assembly protein TadG